LIDTILPSAGRYKFDVYVCDATVAFGLTVEMIVNGKLSCEQSGEGQTAQTDVVAVVTIEVVVVEVVPLVVVAVVVGQVLHAINNT